MTRHRTALVVVCARSRRPHELGRVTVDADGTLTARLDMAVRTSMEPRTDASHAAVRMTIPIEDHDGFRLYCAGCRMLFPTSMGVVRDALHRGQKVLILQPQGWFNNPLGILAKKHPRIASD